MGWAGETCRRPQAFCRFVRIRQAEALSRRDRERGMDFVSNGINTSPINTSPEDDSIATAADIEQRKIFERQRYIGMVFSRESMPQAMINYGRRRLDEIFPVSGEIFAVRKLKRAA